MSVIIEVPGHGELEFPDGMSEAEMEAAIRKNFMLPPKAQPQKMEEPPSFVDRMKKVGLAGAAGLVKGGPVMGAVSAAGEANTQGGQILEAAAYDAGGKVTDITGSPALGFATNVGMQAVPAAAGGSMGKLAAPVAESTGRFLMNNSLKPSKLEHQTGKAKRAVETMLDEGVSVSKGGVERMRSAVNDLNSEIAGIIQNSGKTIDKNAVASRLNDVLKKYEASVDPADLQAIERVWTNFLSHPQLAGKPDMAIQFAQKMKQTEGRKLGEAAYGQGLKPAAERDANKAIVRGLKEEISAAEPAVAPLNARESDLINALKIASNRVAIDANKHPLGLGALISQPWMLPVWMWDRSPLAKSLTARALYSGAGPISTGVGAGVGGIYGSSHMGGGLYP